MPSQLPNRKQGLNKEHPTFELLAQDWRDNLDAYEGTGGFKDGTNLDQFHLREDANDFNERKKRSYYVNYVKRTITGIINALLKSPLQRTVANEGTSGPPSTRKQRLRAFEHNCVRPSANQPFRKVLWDKWIRRNPTSSADIFGHCNTLAWRVENDDTLGFPLKSYVIDISPLAMHNWEIENDQFVRVVWKEIKGDDSKPLEDSGGNQVIPEVTSSRPFYFWEITESAITKYNQDETPVDGFPIENKLRRVPVVRLIWENSRVFPDVGLSTVATLFGIQNRIFNLDSEMTSLEIDQSFSQLVAEGDADFDGQTEFDDDLNKTGRRFIELGARSALMIPEGTTIPPHYISPDPQQLMVLQDRRRILVAEMFRVLGLDGGVSTQIKQVVGAVSKAFDAEELSVYLSDRIDSLIEYDCQVQHLRSLLEGDEAGWTGEITHRRTFAPKSLEQDLVEYQMLKEVGSPQEVLVDLYLKMITKHFADVPGKTKEEWIGLVKQSVTKALTENREPNNNETQGEE